MKPTALTLNIIVAALAAYRWNGAGLVSWRGLLPLVVASVPAAFIGGAVELPTYWYRILIGVVLVLAAAKLFFQPRTAQPHGDGSAQIPWVTGALAGGAVGLLSGLTGTGGGIFLSPAILFFGWAGARHTSGITAPFILVNSVAGLAGNLASLGSLPTELPYFMLAALLGALTGTQFGIHFASPAILQRILAIVLVVAAGKFLLV